MYAPSPYLSKDPTIACNLIDMIVMGTLVTCENSMQGSPLPFMVNQKTDGKLRLISHMDRANPLWKTLQNNQEVMVIFWGPNSYISPSIYTTSPRVPTWFFATVHLKGIPRLIEDEDGLDTIVSDLSQFMEKADSTWQISQVANYKKRLLSAIVGFEIDVRSCQSQIRLGQGNSSKDQNAVYQALSKGNPAEKQVAELMQQLDLT
ncbi:MAG: FMN-binding negative transcriptional regulator [Paraglaciecola sp.]|uniref:FMN-binding negative transcriptional regulator n=1 Tax=Paraglaciecola sp. TaxID=1920173 RepID=UPI003296B23E